MGITNFLYTILYKTTGNTYYCRIVAKDDYKIWNNTSEVMASAPTWANSVITITEETGLAIFPVIIPESSPAGYDYDLVVYEQAGVSPANTDSVEVEFNLKWNTVFGV